MIFSLLRCVFIDRPRNICSFVYGCVRVCTPLNVRIFVYNLDMYANIGKNASYIVLAFWPPLIKQYWI